MNPEMEQPDDVIVLALASGLSQRQAAKRAGVSHSTVIRRMQADAFRLRVSERRGELLNEGAGMVTAMVKDASRTLKKLLASKSDVVRLGAVRCVFESVVALRTVTEFEAQLRALNERVGK